MTPFKEFVLFRLAVLTRFQFHVTSVQFLIQVNREFNETFVAGHFYLISK